MGGKGPEFVFIAACNSEQIGYMFLEAGAKHVVCINTDETVSDKAIREFIIYFYDYLLVKDLRPCEAFKKAKE